MKRIIPWIALASTASFGASSGTITLSGTIPAVTSIVLTGVNSYSSLDLSTTQSDLTVVNVREINNTTQGYTVKVASGNVGAFKNGTLGSLPYSAKYNGVGVILSATPQVVTSSPASNSVVNVVKNFTISYSGVVPESQMTGVYSDTLTFTIISP